MLLRRFSLLVCIGMVIGFGTETVSAHTSRYCTSCERDARGRIKRNSAARQSFRGTNPCPATHATFGVCPGYVVDHIRALKHGGSWNRGQCGGIHENGGIINFFGNDESFAVDSKCYHTSSFSVFKYSENPFCCQNFTALELLL
jgi:hypothetical protein